jgi:hypothetical protein
MMTEQAPDQTPEDVFAALMGSDVKAPEPVPREEVQQAPQQGPTAEPEQTQEVAHAEDVAQETPAIPGDIQAKLARLAELEENFPKLQRDYQAVYGRLAPMQRKIAEYEQAAKASPPAVSKPQPPQDASTEISLPEHLKAMEEDYPEIAAALKRERAEFQRRIEEIAQRVDPVVRQVGFQTEVQRLTQAHPDWQDINASEDFQGFVGWWWENQPPAFRNALGGDDGLRGAMNQADFTIPLLNQYKALRQQAQAAPAPQPQPQSKPSAQNGRRAMSAAPNVRSSGMPPAVDMSNLSEEDQFAMLMQQAGIR